MTLPNRAALARQMRAFVSQSSEISSLQRAMDLLHPSGPRPKMLDIVSGVLYSALRGHEAHTAGVLVRLNDALGRTMADLTALRRGEGLGGRTSAMRANDLSQIAQAMDDLASLESRLRMIIDTDGNGVWAQALRAEVEHALVRPTVAVAPAAVTPSGTALARAGGAAVPTSLAGGIVQLRTAIHAIAAVGDGIWRTRQLPESIAVAARQLVDVAGGNVAEAVRSALRSGGQAADDLVIAILWATGEIEPKANFGTKPHDLHQQQVTNLPFEWKGAYSPNQGHGLGLDGILGGYVVDAKHLGGPLETSPFVTGRQPRRDYTPNSLDGELARAARDPAPTAQRATDLALADKKRGETLRQMKDQLQWAREHGLRGVKWICNNDELADYFRLLAREHLEPPYRNMDLQFVVGGMTGASR
ncbi:hypothetical protein [Ilumatobacter sp.]|uniref:hypothetical protein n=1 Tax=Ilumatobacter sp. TaxID=1967498 RepID=UPI003B523C79